jgi:hypothetical protein
LIAAIRRNLAGIWRFAQPPRCACRCTLGFAHRHPLRDFVGARRLFSRFSGYKAAEGVIVRADLIERVVKPVFVVQPG